MLKSFLHCTIVVSEVREVACEYLLVKAFRGEAQSFSI